MTRAKTNELKKALLAYLSALEIEPGELPPLENPVDVLVEALQLGANHPHGFTLLDLSDAPYPGLASGDPSAPWRMQWAIQVAELEAFTCSAMEETLFLVDTLADPEGGHRVYTAEDGLRGDLEFDDIANALHWMAARVKASAGAKKATLTAATKKYARLLDDSWEEDDRSGWNVFEGLLDSGFAEAWDALSRGEWPILDGRLDAHPSDPHPALARATMTWVTEQFIRTRRVALPPEFDADGLAAVHHALLEQLRDLEAALHSGRAPAAIASALESSDELVQELATAWQSRFKAAQRSLRSAPTSDLDVMPIRRAGKSRGPSVIEMAPPKPAAELGGLADLGDLGDLDDLGDLGDLGDLDLEGDEEFAALERELGQSNVSARSPGPVRGGEAKPTKTSAPKSNGKAGKPGKASKSDDDDLGGLGGALRALLGGGGGDDDEPEQEDVEMTPFNQKLMAALDVLLDRMEADEVIEIIRDRKQMLVREMVRAASDARSPKHMISSLTRALVDSEQVEEIYATDDQIQRLLRGALGG